ncbi:MAG: hypothetical protein IT320_20125 [Anaerolineae bacterium]|nr:hypothetical protein [Anaerolineae bacterium]
MSTRNSPLKGTWSRYLPIVIAIIVVGVLLFFVITDLSSRVQSLENRITDLSVTDSGVNGLWLLAEVNDLQERLDFGIASFNSLISWTQFLGVMIAVVGAVVVLVGIRDSRKDHAELQQVIANAESRLADTQTRLFDAQSKLNEAQNKLTAAESTILAAKEKLTDVERLDAAVKASSEQANETLRRVDKMAADVASLREASAAAQIGQRQLALDNLREAIRLFEIALKHNSEDATLIYLWADAWLRLHGTQGAAQALERLENLHPAKVEYPSASALYAYAARLLGDQAEDEGSSKDVVRFYTISETIYRAVRRKNEFLLDSFGESVFGGLAGLYRRQAKTDETKRSVAIKAYEFCRTITPNSSYVLNNLALLQFCEDQAAAKKTFERCRQLAERKRGDIQNDYWAIFDSVTARIALGDEARSVMEDLKDAISLVRSRAEDDEPIRKFLSGLEELQCKPEPRALQEIMTFVRVQLDPRQAS